MLQLRPYQEDAVAAVRKAYSAGRTRSIVNLPTGTGKTVLGMDLARRALAKGGRALWLAHTDELIRQPKRTADVMIGNGSAVGIVKAGEDEHDAPMVIASVQTACRERRLSRLAGHGGFRLVVVDEAHHAAAKSYQTILEHVARPGTCVVGLTATVERGDSRTLQPAFPGGIAYQLPLAEAIEEGYLVPFRAVREDAPGLVLDEVTCWGGDFGQASLAEALEETAIDHWAADACRKHASGKKALVFTGSVNLAERTAFELNERGIPADWIAGEMEMGRRRAVIDSFKRGEILALCNCQVLTEGFDEPSIEAVVMARPTKSKPLYIQMLGRGLRLSPNKEECVVVDIVANSEAHNTIQAPVLMGVEEREKGEGGGEVGEGNAAKLRNSVRKQWAHWIEDGGAFLATGGGRVTVVALPVDPRADEWEVHMWQDRTHVRLTDRPVWRDMALGMGDDVIRRSEGGSVARRNASWRRHPASEKQLAALAKWRVPIPGGGLKAGEAGDLMSTAIARAHLRSLRRESA